MAHLRQIAIVLILAAADAYQALDIRIPSKADPLERFAAREVARYWYLRTGRLAKIIDSPGKGILVSRKDHLSFRPDSATSRIVRALKPQQYLLKTLNKDCLLIAGGDSTAVLYGAYRFAEKLGVCFYLHGDTVPDKRIRPQLPNLMELGKPLFSIRGINPFHDFPEGPDWWTEDDYLTYAGQLAKMRMNFMGFHCYPEGGVGPEPLVWLGTIDKPRLGYPTFWANTARNTAWGYSAMKTQDLSGGASQLFAEDWHGPDVLRYGDIDAMQVFDRVGKMLNRVFSRARRLGIKTCVGTETPLTIPSLVRKASPEATAFDVYKGAFEWIKNTYPIDYYWLWTPEDWSWSGNKPEQYKATVDDMLEAYRAIRAVQAPFKLATCGWVLGPNSNRAQLNADLPGDVPLSAINQEVGHAPVDPAFGRLGKRERWAIPWLENDPELTSPQLWVGRMRYDASDALKYGCTGLIGIHWRTKAMAANVSALAEAGWRQDWRQQREIHLKRYGAIDGLTANFDEPVGNTEEDEIYQTVRYDVTAYKFRLPNGSYKVRLMFNEPFYDKKGVRVFDVSLQGKKVLAGLDIFERVGKNNALDYRFETQVTNGILQIGFGKVVEYPCVAGIEIRGKAKSIKVNCGGKAVGNWLDDSVSIVSNSRSRSAEVQDFYADFCRANFGPEAAKAIASVFCSIDGIRLIKPATWSHGPGTIKVERLSSAQLRERYAFIDKLRLLRSKIVGNGNLERYDYWLHSFELMREMARVGMLRAELDAQMASPTLDIRIALQTRIALTKAWQAMIEKAIQTVDTPGELGTLFNLESQSRITAGLLTRSDEALTKALGGPLPDSTKLKMSYDGAPRLIVPTVRTSAQPGDRILLRAITLIRSENAPAVPVLHWRPLGAGAFKTRSFEHVGRSVYQTLLPAVPKGAIGIEYYITAKSGKRKVVFPASAPQINQTVVLGL